MPVAGVVEERVKIPDGITVALEGGLVRVSAGKVALVRRLSYPRVSLAVERKEVRIRCELPKRREKAIVGTYASHIRNMIEGVSRGWQYRMKIVYSHFPMKPSVKGKEFVLENFLGERHPRRATIRGDDTIVKIEGDQVTVHGPDLEAVSQTAANIEQMTRIKGFDPRVFQDGIYIVVKAEAPS
uniref:Large ribosomal subunit protein uL6 n=1 Tax=uncultured euryarchaeote Rifle_16ft_4_minimus_10062 TaxID=1665186 RepID=A0A0H4TJI3_9EURY|nr:50S ribosomal protein L6, large subunit ribosomal protein L6 [uncultured euryarchaeote Rifle_16ft_4_minimus_10062]